jgi:elongation factor Ts
MSAALVKELRERTGLGLLESKKAGRTAADGVVAARVADDGSFGVLVEVNSETDFVARDESFLAFVKSVVDAAFDSKQSDVAALMAGELEATREALVQKIGENIGVRRIELIDADSGVVGFYVHSNNRIAVLVKLKGGDQNLAKDVAMHVAAVNPQVVSAADMPEELVAKEKEIFRAQAQESGKPDEIIEKMIGGRVKKFLAENSLLEQAFVKNPDVTVGQLVAGAGAEVTSFVRFEVGEGIQVDKVDFAEEVAAQLNS